MKKQVKIAICFLVLLVGTVTTYAQTAKDVLKKVNEVYYQKAYKMDYKIIGYAEENQVYSYQGFVAKSGVNNLSKSDYEITLVNNDYFMYINNEQKVLVLNEVDNNSKKNTQTTDILSSLDSIIESTKPKLISNNKGMYFIELKQENNPYYESIYLTIDKNYHLTGIQYYVNSTENELTKIEVLYTNIEVKDKLQMSYFTVAKYATVTKNKIIAKGKYKTYKIVDQRKIKEIK